MKSKNLFLFIIIWAIGATVFSQVSQEWFREYNGPSNGSDGGNFIAIDPSGNVYVTGTSDGSETFSDYITIKYNSLGVQQWVSRYSGPGNSYDVPKGIGVDESGNVYVTGWSMGIGTNRDYSTVKYNTEGIEQWVQRLNGAGNYIDEAASIAIDSKGYIYVTGFTVNVHSACVTIKYDSDGVLQWMQTYDIPGADQGVSVAVDVSDNIYVTGITNGIGDDLNYLTIKYNTSGVEQWIQTYSGTKGEDWDIPYSMAVDGAGNVYVTGFSMGVETFYDYATVKYNSGGTEQWVARYNGPADSGDYAISIAIKDGNVYVTGRSFGNGSDYDYATIKYNSAGAEQWVNRFNGSANFNDAANSIALDNSGSIYVTGYSTGNVTGYDYVTIKYNTSGIQQWIQQYNDPLNGSDYGRFIAVDAFFNVYVTGRITGSTGYDVGTLKYSQLTGVNPVTLEIPNEFKLYQNYPNPFNPATVIEYDIPERTHAKLIVYDLNGREVMKLVNEDLQPGSYEIDFDGSNLSSGIYFYKLETDYYILIKKMVLLK